MLVCCTECKGVISDKAYACPHCGNPLQKGGQSTIGHRKKRNRLPNGFGQISEIRGKNLERPFRAMITVGKDDEGKPICKLLKPKGYFHTYNEAYTALIKYHENPVPLSKILTVEELYKEWSEEHFKYLSLSTIQSHKVAWKYCHELYNVNVSDIRISHIKQCINDGSIIVKNKIRHPSPVTKNMIKKLWNLMFDYAVDQEYVDHNYARDFKLPKNIGKEMDKNRKEHIAFTENEMNVLWNHQDDPIVQMILVQCYSGWRPIELCKLKISDIDLDMWTMKGGTKTESGKDRLVPIHPAIRNMIKLNYIKAAKRKSIWLFNHGDRDGITYSIYSNLFEKVIRNYKLNKKHRPHDCRKHFITMAKKADVDEYAIKMIVGHTISDITEKIYTERQTDWLMNELLKIK